MDRSKSASRGQKLKIGNAHVGSELYALGTKNSRDDSKSKIFALKGSSSSSNDRKRDASSSHCSSNKKPKSHFASNLPIVLDESISLRNSAMENTWEQKATEVDVLEHILCTYLHVDKKDSVSISDLCGKIKLLIQTYIRSKTDDTLSVFLIYLAKVRPELFCHESVLNGLISTLRRDTTYTYKGKGNPHLQILASNTFFRVYNDKHHWPEIFIRSYIDDAINERFWVDNELCAPFTKNLCAVFGTRSPSKGILLGDITLNSNSAPNNPDTIKMDEHSEDKLPYESDINTTAKICFGSLNVRWTVKNRYATSFNNVETYIIDAIKEQLNRRQSQECYTRNFLKFLCSTSGLVEVRCLAITRLELWIHNAKLIKSAQELLFYICSNITCVSFKDQEVLASLVKMRLKTKPLINLYMICLKEVIMLHSTILPIILKLVLQNELSNARNPNNMGILAHPTAGYVKNDTILRFIPLMQATLEQPHKTSVPPHKLLLRPLRILYALSQQLNHILKKPQLQCCLPQLRILLQQTPLIRDKPSNETVASYHTFSRKTILLATALVRVRDAAGRWQNARVLFDNGSHASFMTESCMQRLRLPRRAAHVIINGIGSTEGGHSRGQATVTLAPLTSNHQFQIEVFILQKITNELPIANVEISSWPHIIGLPLADPQFFTPGPIDILLGMDEMSQFLTTEVRKGMSNTPLAQNTTFGWVLFGQAGNSKSNETQVHSLHCDVQLVRVVSKFWELEELPTRKHFTAEEIFCERNFDTTHRRTADGRFIVRLPMRNANIHEDYKAFMQELLDMKHMEPVDDIPINSFYMPHHAVLKSSSETTKLRVVFDASMKSSSGNSLNDPLLVGPQLQHELFAVLLRFRTHRYAMTADVAKMYRQVCVSDDCTDYQRVVWRANPSEPLRDYRLLRVTYGMASASHLAVKALQQTAKNNNATHPAAAEVILRDFYMDDLLTGSSTKEALLTLQIEISEVLSTGCFELRKWATNCNELLLKLPHATKQVSHFLADSQEVRALGLTWNTQHDFITFEVNLNEPPSFLSKRAFLSDASLIFDPLGLVAPCTIRSKIWFQQIWRAGVDWDQAVPTEIAMKWFLHRLDLSNLAKLKLPRWLGTGEIGSITEIHVFADASERAYAAVLYTRTLLSDGSIKITLVASRTKVAPLKTTTLPRLELCAAHLAAKLTRHVLLSLDNNSYRLYAWSDSTVAIAWLQGHPSRWSTFVANRVAQVQEVLSPECWAHVISDHNPADCASRGIAPSDLLHHHLWWQGPPWLKHPQNTWPKNDTLTHATNLEARTERAVSYIAQPVEHWELLTRYSSYQKLKRVTAYVMRFVDNVRAKARQELRRTVPLVCYEIRTAEISLVKYTQNHSFSNEILCCRTNKQLPLRSSLLRLQPFLDQNNILRVGGRIKNANLSVDVKHPIVLPKGSPLAKLIIEDIHAYTLHGGPKIMQTVLQRRFWVVAARNLIRKTYRNCVTCTRINRLPLHQVMGDLPLSRTIYTRCFLRSAVDFAGPYSYKYAAGRGTKAVKGYIAIFICMGTGAMHIEFAGDLSSVAFLNAYKRFISRRGYCKHMHSDNGTNFVGAEKELRNMLEGCLADAKVRAFFADSAITWHFNPPSAPHMGGFWETGVKRVKYHLKRAISDTLLTFEEFSTLLTEIEACVNSRPLCSHTNDSCDLEVLTPGHFIVGEPLRSLPEPEAQMYKGTLGQRWAAITAMRQHFWRRWRDEYLVGLQQHSKWFRHRPNVQKDDIVVIFDENAPPTKWKMGRIMECNPGLDGHVRVVKLKTAFGELVRPIAKICRLPTKNDIFSDI